MLASTNPVWLQTAFDTLTGISDQVGLQKNFWKTVGMGCKLCWAVRIRSYEAYKRLMMGEGKIYQGKQQ